MNVANAQLGKCQQQKATGALPRSEGLRSAFRLERNSMEETRRCIACGISQPVSLFPLSCVSLKGETKRIGRCKACKDAWVACRIKPADYASVKPISKDHARSLVSSALRRGILKKQPCEVCGKRVVDAHHDDYTKPLEVRWLCRTCHLQWHQHNEAKGFG